MGSRPWKRTPGGQDALFRSSCCAFHCCCPAPASCWPERCPMPQLPILRSCCPADFPVPVVNGAPVAPVLNTTPEQTQYWQQAQVAQSPAAFPVTTVNGENVAPGYNTVPAQTAAHENHLLIAQQQQLQQLIDAQTIQHRVQQQEIEAARHFGRL